MHCDECGRRISEADARLGIAIECEDDDLTFCGGTCFSIHWDADHTS